MKEFMYVTLDGFGEGGEDVSSSSPSVDSTTPGDLDTLNIPNADVKTKFDVVSTGDGSCGMLDPTNSGNNSTSKRSKEAMNSEQEQSVNTKLNEEAKTTPKSEASELGPPADGLVTTVKTDQDVGEVDQNSSYTPVGSSSGLAVPSVTSEQQQRNINQQQKQAVRMVDNNTSINPHSTKCGTPEQHGPVSSDNVLSPGSSAANQNTRKADSKDMVTSNTSSRTPVITSEKELSNGVIRQGLQNVTVTMSARRNPHCFGGGNVYPHGHHHPRSIDPPIMGMPHGSAMAMSTNNNLGPMSPHNNVSPPQASVPPQMRHSGFTSPNHHGDYSHHNVQFNPQMEHQGVSMPSMNGQVFANISGNMNHNNGQWYGQMAMVNERSSIPHGRTMKSPQPVSQYPQDCYGPVGFSSPGHPNPQQNPHGFENQYNQLQKNMAYGVGAFAGQNMHNFNEQNASPFCMNVLRPNQQHDAGNYNPQQTFGESVTIEPRESAPGPSAGIPMVHHRKRSSKSVAGGAGKTEGSFTGYHGNQLTHFPRGRKLPTPPGSGGVGQVPSTAIPVNSKNDVASSNHHTQQSNGNFINNYGPNLNSSFILHQQQQIHNSKHIGPHQIYAPMDTVNINQCTRNSTPPFNAQYNSPYANQQQTGSHDNSANSQVTSSGNDVTSPMGSPADIPEFSMFGEYGPQPEYY